MTEMARYYYRRSAWSWIVGFLVAVIAFAFVARVIAAWIVPLVPVAGAGLLLIALVWTGFRRR